MALFYMSGEEIKKGDKVRFHREPGEIEVVADPEIADPESDWFVKEYGGGVMIAEPKYFGRAFLPDPRSAEDLEFVARKT